MTTYTLRSSAPITKFVTMTDRLASLMAEAERLDKEIASLTPEVLDLIGERKECRINGQIRILTPRIVESISGKGHESEIIAFCESREDLKDCVKTRTPKVVHPATVSKLVRDGVLPGSIIERTVETQVTVV